MRRIILLAFFLLSAFAYSSEAGVKYQEKNLKSEGEKHHYLPILNRWSGDFSIAQLGRLKNGYAQAHAGYIGDEVVFASFWETFKKGTAVPRVDFSKNLVVFVIGDRSYKQLFVAKVTLKDTIAEVVTDGNISSSPPDDCLALALAVFPRRNIKFILVGKEQIAVE